MMGWIVFALGAWAVGWGLNVWLSRRRLNRAIRLAMPVLFGLTLIAIWEGVVRGCDISAVLLPAPSVIAVTFAGSTAILWEDFVQTVIKGALSGYVLGCGAAIVIAIATIDL